ncbi:MAG TPA: cell division protein FtsA [Candidatus Dependentiae bacterium]|nr:cell division protein FtsA [Candidatus Dependentiae bacterium]HRQ62939.1 cell division protein FtsA [Candidatus Dependentiae bacterium]
MAKINSDRLITSVDVGTTKICVFVARQLDDDRLEVIGIGKSPSDGLKKGVVVDVARTVHSIRAAIKEAELMAGIDILTASVGIAGAHISSRNSHGVVAIKRGEITKEDVQNALNAARAIPIAEGEQILHVLSQYFIIDGKDRVLDPIGMHGIRLEVQAHIILGAIASVQNLVKCCQAAGIQVNDIVLEPLASAEAVLSPDEKELGVAVLDIGGGTSDLAIYQQSSIRHTMVLPVAGNHFTNDLAIGLRTTIADAERVKVLHGTAYKKGLKQDDLVEVEMVQGGKKHIIQLTDLAKILEPRARELLSIVHEEVISKHLQSFMATGLVITGGGSLLHGMQEVAQEIFGVPVRIGNPRIEFDLPQSLHNPMYATGYGLLLYTLKKKHNSAMNNLNSPLMTRVFDRMKSWVLDFF